MVSFKSSFKRNIISALFWATVGAALLPALATANTCTPIFEKVHLASELDKEYRLLSKQAKLKDGVSHEKAIEIRARLVRLMEIALKRATTAQEIVDILRTSEAHAIDTVIIQAINSVDWLAPVRINKSLLDDGVIKNYIESGHVSQGIVDAFQVVLKPEHALTVVSDIIRDQTEILSDFLNQGSNFNRTLMVSLESVPASVRTDAINRVVEGIKLADKETARELQRLQLILARTHLLSTIEKLNALQAKNAAPNELYRALSEWSQQRTSQPAEYGMERAVEAAKIMQLELRHVLKSGEYVEMFGSYPNQRAKLGLSDIDMVFSLKLDDIYRADIRGSDFSVDGFATTKSFPSAEAQALAHALLSAESQMKVYLGSNQSAGELLSVATIPTTLVRGQAMRDMSREEFLTFLTMLSPVTIVVSKDAITIRIYDSWGVPAGSDAIVHEFTVH